MLLCTRLARADGRWGSIPGVELELTSSELPPASPIYYKRIKLRKSQREEMHRARDGERVPSSHASPGAPLSPLPAVLIVTMAVVVP